MQKPECHIDYDDMKQAFRDCPVEFNAKLKEMRLYVAKQQLDAVADHIAIMCAAAAAKGANMATFSFPFGMAMSDVTFDMAFAPLLRLGYRLYVKAGKGPGTKLEWVLCDNGVLATQPPGSEFHSNCDVRVCFPPVKSTF